MMKNTILFFCAVTAVLSIRGQTIEPSAVVNYAHYYALDQQGLSLHASMGELASEYLAEGQPYLSQGFLQPVIDLVPIQEVAWPELQVQLGPNPCVDYFILTQNLGISLQVELLDLYGRRLKTADFSEAQLHISVIDLPAGNYFLRITEAGRAVFETMKLVKL